MTCVANHDQAYSPELVSCSISGTSGTKDNGIQQCIFGNACHSQQHHSCMRLHMQPAPASHNSPWLWHDLAQVSELCHITHKCTGSLFLNWSLFYVQGWERGSHGTGMGHTTNKGFWIPEKPVAPPQEEFLALPEPSKGRNGGGRPLKKHKAPSAPRVPKAGPGRQPKEIKQETDQESQDEEPPTVSRCQIPTLLLVVGQCKARTSLTVMLLRAGAALLFASSCHAVTT